MTLAQDNMCARPAMTISTVERDTGLGKDTLRVWERRYGFPQPERDHNGERVYPAEQVERLRLMKRLIDQGYRPGKLCAASDEELARLCNASAPARDGEPGPSEDLIRQLIRLVKANDVPALRHALNQSMMRLGLQSFVMDVVARLNHAVGEAWMNGEFAVFEEHLYTEQMKALLRQAIGSLPQSGGRPRILLTTVPDEQHVLGLLMAEALLVLEGATCISLGTQTPLFDIQMAAVAHQADIVAVSFSAAFPARQVGPLANQLRELLPTHIELWVGGAGAHRAPASPSGTLLLPNLPAALDGLSDWRTRHATCT
ncbi:transcriptional regulator, MerR family [Candidatus Accumulibacter phosphatis]|jgi:DNA-binding transcriptional MerR regulator/methylmalonyl-CoA mutase cobalamin-binding subunit|uniref:Transcriptional regulator, MerR family n=2 Tax=Candidatus Accumulibacter TaxID=327159 RepID=C7RN62_ACCRE